MKCPLQEYKGEFPKLDEKLTYDEWKFCRSLHFDISGMPFKLEDERELIINYIIGMCKASKYTVEITPVKTEELYLAWEFKLNGKTNIIWIDRKMNEIQIVPSGVFKIET